MTSHEFARQLLDGPDLPILVPRCLEYDDGDNCTAIPFVGEPEDGEDFDGNPIKVLIIDRHIDDK